MRSLKASSKPGKTVGYAQQAEGENSLMKYARALIAATLAITFAGVAGASSVIFDRGLPTENVNNFVSANPNGGYNAQRSNIVWARADTTQLIGDTFRVSGGGHNPNAIIDSMTFWFVSRPIGGVDSLPALTNPNSQFNLWVGETSATQLDLAGSGSTAAASATVTEFWYDASWTTSGLSQQYQRGGQEQFPMYEVTLHNLNYSVTTNTDYYFAVSAMDSNQDLIPYMFLHGANAGNSRDTDPMEGHDNLYRFFDTTSGSVVYGGTIDSQAEGHWEHPSDINIVLTGTIVPVPPAAGLILLGMAGMGLRRKFAKK